MARCKLLPLALVLVLPAIFVEANIFLNGEYQNSINSHPFVSEFENAASKNIFLEHAIISRQAQGFTAPMYLPPKSYIKCGSGQQCVKKNVCAGGYFTNNPNGYIQNCDVETDVCCTYRAPPTTTQRPSEPCAIDSDCVAPSQCSRGTINVSNYVKKSSSSRCYAPEVCCRIPATTLTPDGYVLTIPQVPFPKPPSPPTYVPPAPPAPPSTPFRPQTYQPPAPPSTPFRPQTYQPPAPPSTPYKPQTYKPPAPPAPPSTPFRPQTYRPPAPPAPPSTPYKPLTYQPPAPPSTPYKPQTYQPPAPPAPPSTPFKPQTYRPPAPPAPPSTPYKPLTYQPPAPPSTPYKPQTYQPPRAPATYIPPPPPSPPAPPVFRPRPTAPTRPVNAYLPPKSAQQPGYTPIGSPSVNVPVRGEAILSEPIFPTRKPTPFSGSNNFGPSIPQTCAAALVCTDVNYCDSQGLITTSPSNLTPQQAAFRTPLTDCTVPSSGAAGKCCRDPNYVDPWPVNPSGQCAARNRNTKPRGVTEEDTSFAEIPWQAMVLKESSKTLLCGGAIIGYAMVMTTASCLNGQSARDVVVKAGEWQLGSDDEPLPFQLIRATEIVSHPEYNPQTGENNLAIILLEKNLKTAIHIGPICISDQDPSPSEKCIVTGWGKDALKIHEQGALLHQTPAEAVSRSACGASNKQVCAKTKYDACNVDYGSALACGSGNTYKLKGIFTSEDQCGNSVATFVKPDVKWINTAFNNNQRALLIG